MHEIRDDFRALRVGPAPMDLDVGPLIRQTQQERVESFLAEVKASGIATVAQGQIVAEAPASGFYAAPTLLRDVPITHRVAQEEVFGPVASILRARDEADALRLANDTPFGLGASIFSADVERAWQLGRDIEAGAVFINRYTSSDLRLPFGGVKASGYGRELSEFGLYEFVNVKTYWQK